MQAMGTRTSVQNSPGYFYSAQRWVVVIWALALFCCTSAQAATRAQSWRIDEAQTWIGFKIDAIGFPTTRGHFTHYRGQVLLDFDRPAKSFTTFTVESGSVDVGSPAFNDFVKSGALLDAERFPTMSFTSTQVEKLDAHTARVTGNLTMLGVRKPITLTVNVETEPNLGQRRLGGVRSKRYDPAIGFRNEIWRPADRQRARDHRQDARA
jgi:polyisoprenoid-binding protein YceI